MKDLEAKFVEIEKRVRALASVNNALRKHVHELEQELAQARREAQELQHFHGKKMHVREKIEKVLAALEGIRAGE